MRLSGGGLEMGDAMLDRDRERSVLVVDDENQVRHLVMHWLETSGYIVQEAGNADEALAAMERQPSAVALCDIRMPGHDGMWLAGHLRRHFPDTAIIMATAVHDVEPAVTSLRQGVLDYLMKPFGRDRVREAVQRGVDWHRAAVDARRWRDQLAEEYRARVGRLADAIGTLRIDSEEEIDALLAMLTLRDSEAYAHAYRVVGFAVCVARLFSLDDDDVVDIERAALLHDLGKLAMPEAILRKPAPLTNEERALIRTHPQIAYELTRAIPCLADAAELVWACCERADGQGYPRGLRGEAIPFGSRIIAVADAYDTMTRTRVFRDAISAHEAFLELARCAGTQFDPAVVEAFRRVVTVH